MFLPLLWINFFSSRADLTSQPPPPHSYWHCGTSRHMYFHPSSLERIFPYPDPPEESTPSDSATYSSALEGQAGHFYRHESRVTTETRGLHPCVSKQHEVSQWASITTSVERELCMHKALRGKPPASKSKETSQAWFWCCISIQWWFQCYTRVRKIRIRHHLSQSQGTRIALHIWILFPISLISHAFQVFHSAPVTKDFTKWQPRLREQKWQPLTKEIPNFYQW